MALRTQRVLRLRRTDNKSDHALVNVAKTGRKDLDLKLIGTDKESLFAATVKETETESLRERNFTGDLEEWKTLLSFTLCNRRPKGPLPDFLQGVEAVSAISGSTLTITFRKNISGITQRLGSIKLQETDDVEINALDWADTAVATSDELRNQLETVQASVDLQKDQIAKLTTELDMLVRAKKEHEDELLSKFAALLNAKKLKIRDQQRLLNGARIDLSAAEEVSSARSSRTPRKAGPSRGSKRKASSAASPEGEDQEDAETVDGTDTADGESRRQEETPVASDVDPATETEDEDEVAPRTSAAAVASQASTQGNGQRAAENMDLDEIGEAPPLRELPFKPKQTAKPAEAPTPPPTSAANDDEDDETDDDEL